MPETSATYPPTIAGIRSVTEAFGPSVLAGNTRRLLDVAEAALRLAGDWEETAARIDRAAEADPAFGLRSALLSGRAQALSEAAEGLREAIAGALAGQDGT